MMCSRRLNYPNLKNFSPKYFTDGKSIFFVRSELVRSVRGGYGLGFRTNIYRSQVRVGNFNQNQSRVESLSDAVLVKSIFQEH